MDDNIDPIRDENAPTEDGLTPDQVEEEAKAEEEFISEPEDTVLNPLVPEEPKEEDDRLEGSISSGDLSTDYPEEPAADPVSNEANTDAAALDAEEPAPVEEAPAEDVAPVEGDAPAEEAAPAVDEAAVSEEAKAIVGAAIVTDSVAPKPAEDAAVATDAPKKKSKKGLIITLIIILVLLAGGAVAAVVWLGIFNSPKVAVSDAISNLWKKDNAKYSLSANVMSKDFNFELSRDKNGAEISGVLPMSTGSNAPTFNALYRKGGTFYVKLSGVKDSIESNMSVGSLDADSAALLKKVATAATEDIDDNWLKLEINDSFLSSIGLKNGVGDCIVSTFDGFFEQSTYDEMAKIYEEHPFFTINESAEVKEKDGVRYYKVTVNTEEAKKFVEALSKADFAKRGTNCVESIMKSYTSAVSKSGNTLSSSSMLTDDYDSSDSKCLGVDGAKCGSSTSDYYDIDPIVRGTPTTESEVLLGITTWTHELVSISLDGSEDEIKIDYGKAKTSDPGDAKDVMTVLGGIEAKVKTAFKDAILEKYKEYCEDYGAASDECVNSLSQYVTDDMIDEAYANMLSQLAQRLGAYSNLLNINSNLIK